MQAFILNVMMPTSCTHYLFFIFFREAESLKSVVSGNYSYTLLMSDDFKNPNNEINYTI